MSDERIEPEVNDDGDPIWTVAGYLDFEGEYHDLQDTDPFSLDFYPDADLVTISWIDANDGSEQYARLVGPFEDLEDLEDRVDTYFEEGTP